MTWRAVLSPPEQDRALAIVQAIAGDLRARFDGSSSTSESEAWSLALGRSGVAIFFAYLGEALGEGSARVLAARLIEDALDAAVGVAPVDRLFAGIAGIGWALAIWTCSI